MGLTLFVQYFIWSISIHEALLYRLMLVCGLGSVKHAFRFRQRYSPSTTYFTRVIFCLAVQFLFFPPENAKCCRSEKASAQPKASLKGCAIALFDYCADLFRILFDIFDALPKPLHYLICLMSSQTHMKLGVNNALNKNPA